MRVSLVFALIVAIGCIAAERAWAHYDVRPVLVNGKIVTHAYDDDDGDTHLNVKVFGYDFGEDEDDPLFVADPGFNSPSGSGLPSGSLLFEILSGLLYWDGIGAPIFAGVPDDESLVIYKGTPGGTNSRQITESSGTQSGFAIGTISGSGSIHAHLNTQLWGSDGNAIPADDYGSGPFPGDGIEPTSGIYAFSMRLTHSTGTVDPSDPIWIVYNNGLSEELHEVAMAAIPEPSMLGLSALAVMALVRRRARV